MPIPRDRSLSDQVVKSMLPVMYSNIHDSLPKDTIYSCISSPQILFKMLGTFSFTYGSTRPNAFPEDGKVTPDGLRTLFAASLSQMYRNEVPQYGDLVQIVRQVNEDVLGKSKATENDDSAERISLERHGEFFDALCAHGALVSCLFLEYANRSSLVKAQFDLERRTSCRRSAGSSVSWACTQSTIMICLWPVCPCTPPPSDQWTLLLSPEIRSGCSPHC